MFRARKAAIDELIRAGVPPNNIDAGFEYGALLQVERYGYLNDDRIRFPKNVYVDYPNPFPKNCMQYERGNSCSCSRILHFLGFSSVRRSLGLRTRRVPSMAGAHTVTLYIDSTLPPSPPDRNSASTSITLGK